MAALGRLLAALPLLLISPFVSGLSALALALTDLVWVIAGRARMPADRRPSTAAASVVIPNWNGRDLLARYLPSIVSALAGNPANEIIVVDNGSTDGSAEFLREHFPAVRVLALDRNLGFGGGSNAGFRAASNDIVVLLNSDMRVEADFLRPLLEGFADDRTFAVSCQIFFSDPTKVREETGLTQAWWEDGMLRVRHRIDEAVSGLYPCFYGGGGSCAFDRRKFLELGGFDEILAPFYLEDTDLGYMAWKRGWKVYFEPRSVVYHEHRGTIGKKFSEAYIQSILRKNYVLFAWKNIHDWRKLTASFFYTWAGAATSALFGEAPLRPNFNGLFRAFAQLPGAIAARWRARQLAAVSDSEAFRRPLGGYFRDRFQSLPARPDPLRVLFISPYPILPPAHGGGVFMSQTLRQLVKHAEVHVIALLDHPDQLPANEELRDFCASAEFIVRLTGKQRALGSIVPHAVREFSNGDLEWLIHRQILNRSIDVVQLEYTPLGQYACDFRQIGSVLFEHDVYFQSVGRALDQMRGLIERVSARFEYLRAIRFELNMLRRCDRIQVCTRENGDYLASFLPAIRSRLEPGLRAGIDTSRYEPAITGRDEDTMLFLGGFRHTPNQIAVDWFLRNCLASVRAARPNARLIVIGPDPPPPHAYANYGDAVEFRGFVDDIREPLARCSLFLCPIQNGSGVRVKLLEAFAAGIPVVSTRVGAEGLARQSGDFCLLADDPHAFAQAVIEILERPQAYVAMAERARNEVVANWDMAAITAKLAISYRALIAEKRSTSRLLSAGGPA